MRVKLQWSDQKKGKLSPQERKLRKINRKQKTEN